MMAAGTNDRAAGAGKARRSAVLRSASGTRQRPRTCAGCREEAPRADLLRVVLGEDGQVVPDLTDGAFGRGAWVHPSVRCLELALPRGFSKSFKQQVLTRPEEFQPQLAAAAAQRVKGLVLAARRTQALAIGASAVEEAALGGRAALILVSRDARAAADLGVVQHAIAEGRAVAFGTTAEWGEVLSREAVAVLAVADARIAESLQRAATIANLTLRSEERTDLGEHASREDG